MNQFDEYSKDALRTAGEGNLLEMSQLVKELYSILDRNDVRLPKIEIGQLAVKMKLAAARDEHKVGIMYDALGLAGEAGELADYIKKWVGHGKKFDPEHVKKELGDQLWYINRMVVHRLGGTLLEIAQKNIAKLKARYPQGFSHRASEDRKE